MAEPDFGGLALSVPDAAKMLGVGRNTLYDAVKRGEIPTIRIGRRLLIPRHGLAVALGGAPEPPPAPEREALEGSEEWTYVVTVRRLKAGETVRAIGARDSSS